jgi:hypothetical protein
MNAFVTVYFLGSIFSAVVIVGLGAILSDNGGKS